MLRKTHRTILLSAALPLAASVALVASSPPAAAQITVFDPSNYSENVLTAARTLQQINNQIQSLQNEATMLRNMTQNLEKTSFPDLAALTSRLDQINQLLQQAQGIDFRTAQLDQQFRAMFPDFDAMVSVDERASKARARLDTAMTGIRHTMQVQAKVAENLEADAKTLAKVSEKNESPTGALQVGQFTNQLLSLATKQQMQIQELLAAQFRAEAVEQARRAQATLDAQAATKKFLGSGTAYTPR